MTDEQGFYVSEFDLVVDEAGYVGGAHGTSILTLARAAQIIDVVVTCRAKTFALDHFFVGNRDMLPDWGGVDADVYAPTAVGRTVRFTTLQGGERACIEFRNRTDDPRPEPIGIRLKVRSRHPREALLSAVDWDVQP